MTLRSINLRSVPKLAPCWRRTLASSSSESSSYALSRAVTHGPGRLGRFRGVLPVPQPARSYSTRPGTPPAAALWPYFVVGGISGGLALAVNTWLSTSTHAGTADATLEHHDDSHTSPSSSSTARTSTSKDPPNQPPAYASPDACRAAIAELRALLPDPDRTVLTDARVLQAYGASDHSYHAAAPHAVVVRPTCTADVVAVVRVARKHRMPLTPYSGATSLEGHFAGFPSGSICVDMGGMNKILDVHVDDADLVCQAGARWEDINEYLKERGIPLFFPLDPGPGATIGGMIGTGCSGTNAVRYGTARGEWFLNLTVVLPSGEVITTKRRARKSATGFDATKLFVGAEGTLGIVTEATLRLAPVLPTRVAMAQFPDVERAVGAVQEILQSPYGSNVQCVELLDDHMMAALNSTGLVDDPLPVQDSLFFKLQGAPDAIARAADTVARIARAHGGGAFAFARTDAEADALWTNRKYALNATLASAPGARCWTTDVCVPVSKLPELVHETKKDLAQAGITATIVGHVGDGNFHALLLFRDDAELRAVEGAVHRLVQRAVALDGTCTGEHGVGVGKKAYLVDELGRGTVALMWAVKNAIDPLNIMNPGKLYPDLEQKQKDD